MRPSSAKTLVVNGIWFQLCWLSAVLLNNVGLLCALLLLHAVVFVKDDLKQYLALAIVGSIGILVDQSLSYFGVFVFTKPLIPLWLMLLWLCFSSTLGYSLSYFRNKPLISAVFGAIGGSLSYYAGIRFGAVSTDLSTAQFFIIVGAIWSAMFPLLMWLYHKVVR